MLDPTHLLLASQLLYDKNTRNLILSQIKSMLNPITRLNNAARRFGQPEWLPIAKIKLEIIQERIQIGFIDKHRDLTSLVRERNPTQKNSLTDTLFDDQHCKFGRGQGTG